MEEGVHLAVKLQNAAGGIHGRQIDYRIQDTATQPGKIQEATSAASNQGAVAFLAYDDPDSVLSSAPLVQVAGHSAAVDSGGGKCGAIQSAAKVAGNGYLLA